MSLLLLFAGIPSGTPTDAPMGLAFDRLANELYRQQREHAARELALLGLAEDEITVLLATFAVLN